MVIIPTQKSKVPSYVKTLREQSLTFHGGSLFNSLPHNIRAWTGSKECFKKKLDEFLTNIPDHPYAPGLVPEPVCSITCKNSNSITDWVRYLKIGERRPEIMEFDSLN